MKYQHKMEVFEAVQWTGDNFDEVREFAPSADINSGILSVRDWDNDRRAVAVGYYIVAHPLGGHYAISPTVFGQGYEPVSPTLQSQLAASHERERILREGLEEYAQTRNWAHTEMNSPYRNLWMQWSSGYDIAAATIKAAGKVKG